MPIYPSDNASNLTVSEVDGSPSAIVSELVLPNGTVGIVGDVATVTFPATTDASLLVSGTLADARLSSNVPRLNTANTYTAKQTANVGINVANNQYIEFARTTGYVGWFLFGVNTSNILLINANNASLSLDPTSGVVTSAGSIQIGGSTGPLIRNNAGTIESRNSANNAMAPFGCGLLTVGGPVILSTSTTGAVAGALYRVGDTVRTRDSTNTERILLNNLDNLANLGSVSTAQTNLGLGTGNNVTFAGLTVTNGTTLGVRTLATLPLASTVNGQTFEVSDSPIFGNRFLTSNGTTYFYQGTAYEVGTSPSGGSSAWGGITGTLSSQTDLQIALNARLTWGKSLAANFVRY